ncbi:MAG TPA: hypothetical protein VHX37_02670 [Acidobacteriaceae bacterium]|jgi:hypothetical protein|nr:hypothetical protein [Acidobacteriaceae bacterium]
MKTSSVAALVLPVVLLSATAASSAQTPAKTPVQTIALVDAPMPINSSSSLLPEPAAGTPAFMPVARTPLPTAEQKPRLDFLDWSLIGAAAALRGLDWASTESALARPQYFHEAVLPNALVRNKAGFAAFQAGTVAVNYEAYKFLVRHNRRSLARLSQYMYVGIMTLQVAHNYQTLGDYPPN